MKRTRGFILSFFRVVASFVPKIASDICFCLLFPPFVIYKKESNLRYGPNMVKRSDGLRMERLFAPYVVAHGRALRDGSGPMGVYALGFRSRRWRGLRGTIR